VRLLHVEHPDGGGPGVFGDVAPLERWRAWTDPPPEDDHDAIVLYGGSTNVADAAHEPWLRDELAWLRERLDAGTPVLGVCLGAQLVAAALGAEVARSDPPEIGWLDVALTGDGVADPVLGALPARFTACQWHSWTFAVPGGATLLARSPVCPQAFRRGSAWGVQFHPEVDAPTLARWNATYREDPDAVAQDFDPEAAQEAARERLSGWNDLGRRLFGAFVAEVRRSGHAP
jgi:GMP synthase-like glutamine amidotransferase